MDGNLLNDIVIIFILSVVVLYLCNRIRIPSIVGFLITGILAGPHGLALVSSVDQVEVIAEVGVIFLLFSIGIEFSFKELMDIRKTVLLGGTVQVLLCILFSAVAAMGFGMSWQSAVFIGCLVSLSSTAIVLKQLGERAELATPHGKIDLGILIYQDIIVVPMMLFTPILAGHMGQPVSMVLLKTAAVIVLVLILANYVIPPFLYQVTRTQSRELFLLSIIAICFSVAYLTNSAGLSLALGAFLAGLIIAESEYSHQALSNILPFIDTFTSVFFVSIGMLLDTGMIVHHWQMLILFTVLLILIKALAAVLAAMVLGYPLRTAILVGFSLCQVGEFSFILAQSGMNYNLMSELLYQGFLSASILTMMLTPFFIILAPRIARRIMALPLPAHLLRGQSQECECVDEDLSEHLLIVGYGVNGRNIARAAHAVEIPYLILEINTDTVRTEKRAGQPIIFGDATQDVVLINAGIERAKMMVVAIHDAAATRRITATARRLNPGLHILVRTRFVADVKDLEMLGANEVIPEEYETSIEIFSRVLTRYLVPRDQIERYVEKVRKEDYEMFRNLKRPTIDIQSLNRMHLVGMDICTVRVDEGALASGQAIEAIELRKKFGVTILAIQRGEQMIPNPGAEDRIEAEDHLILLGPTTDIQYVNRELFSKPVLESPSPVIQYKGIPSV